MSDSPLLGITPVAASQSQKEVPINAAILALEDATQRGLDVSVAAVSAPLTNLQFRRNFVFRITGATVAGRTLTVPAIQRFFMVRSDAANTQTISVVRGTTSIALAPGETVIFRTDGTANGLFLASRSAITFQGLADTPANYTGQAHRAAVVNGAETGLAFRRDRLDATVDPVATDDSAAGYAPGSRWHNTVTRRLWLCLDATAGAAVWQPTIARETMPRIAGTWYEAEEWTSTANVAIAADTLYLCPLTTLRNASCDALSVRIVTGIGGANARLGLYAAAPDGLPGALLRESTDQSAATSSSSVISTITPITLVAGRLYYVGMVFSDAVTPVGFNANGGGGITRQTGFSSPVNAGGGSQIARLTRSGAVAYVTGSPFLPDPFGTLVLSGGAPGSPICWWRAA